MKKNLFTVPAALLVSGLMLSCEDVFSSSSDDNGPLLAALLLATPQGNCQIGAQRFFATDGISCENGQATGNGHLVSVSNSPDELFAKVKFSLESGGSLDIRAGGSREGLASDGFGLRFQHTGLTHAVGPNSFSLDVNAGGAVDNRLDYDHVTSIMEDHHSGAGAGDWMEVCIEWHVTEEPNVHLLAAATGESDAKADTSCDVTDGAPHYHERYNSADNDTRGPDANWGTSNGLAWGIVSLNNATILEVSIDDHAVYDDHDH